ncbi:MAG: ATP-binding protein, partial [Pseudomonadota bacterium]
RALASNDFQQTSQRLISFVDEIGAAGIMLLNSNGRVVATTERARLGELHQNAAFFVDALRSDATVFTARSDNTTGIGFAYSRRVTNNQMNLGVVVVEADLQKFQTAWGGVADAVIVANSQGEIILATEQNWLGVTEEEALALRSAPSAIERALQATQGWGTVPADAYLQGRAVMRQELRVPFQGWRMTLYTTYGGVRQRVNAALALVIMGFAIIFALAFYQLSRQTLTRALLFQKESEDLRQLNSRLQREIAERQKIEKNLEVAEQTLAQSSKLAALGEMSAAVSHELNQPLAAMKTYLAGARLLLSRNRPDEALSSFQRIDDLIGRMGAITKQLKSYARQDGRDFQPVNMADAVNSSLALMEPQLRQRKVDITRTLPETGVWVMGDRVRIEQVIINLRRNAVDATQTADEPIIEVLLVAGDTVSLTVRDNGTGIVDIDNLFEPFYTTKQPGDG